MYQWFTLWWTNIAMENHHAFHGKIHYKWAMFHCYVSSPEGISPYDTSPRWWLTDQPAVIPVYCAKVQVTCKNKKKTVMTYDDIPIFRLVKTEWSWQSSTQPTSYQVYPHAKLLFIPTLNPNSNIWGCPKKWGYPHSWMVYFMENLGKPPSASPGGHTLGLRIGG